jgi:hypothetical protein
MAWDMKFDKTILKPQAVKISTNETQNRASQCASEE